MRPVSINSASSVNLVQDDDRQSEVSALETLLVILLRPTDLSVDNWENFRPRLLTLALFVLSLAIVFFNAFYLILGYSLALPHQVTIVGALSALIAVYLYYRVGGQFALIANLFLAISFIIISMFVGFSGGYQSPVMQTFILLPFLAFTLTPPVFGQSYPSSAI